MFVQGTLHPSSQESLLNGIVFVMSCGHNIDSMAMVARALMLYAHPLPADMPLFISEFGAAQRGTQSNEHANEDMPKSRC